MNYLLPLFSVLLGYGLALFLKPKSKSKLKLLLAFSGSFLLSLTVMHLLPEVYESHNHNIGLFIMAGFCSKLFWNFSPKVPNTDTFTDTKKCTIFLGYCSSVFVFTPFWKDFP